MRDLTTLVRFRQQRLEQQYFGGPGNHGNGVFVVPSDRDGTDLRVVAADGGGWDHVSVSTATRIPTWEEMEQIKRLFFQDTETAMQLHVPPADHINCNPYTLHLWRPNVGRPIPRPPSWMVGPMRAPRDE